MTPSQKPPETRAPIVRSADNLCKFLQRPTRKPFRIVHKGFPDLAAADWADASRLYSERRDQLGLGASMFPEALLMICDLPVGRISYNGRIWPLGDWRPGTPPLYDNQPCAN